LLNTKQPVRIKKKNIQANINLQLSSLGRNTYEWFQFYCTEIHFFISYISLCNAPELDDLGVEISKIVEEFLAALNINEQSPHFISVTEHDKFLDLLEKIFDLIHGTTKKLSPYVIK